jgi:NAD(P)-dependent dehydrogenase (short-subunit alcohol dehydrogenase family)
MPTIAIVGAGPGVGDAVARQFSREAYDGIWGLHTRREGFRHFLTPLARSRLRSLHRRDISGATRRLSWLWDCSARP